MKVGVTGATGFVGGALIEGLRNSKKFEAVAIQRYLPKLKTEGVEYRKCENLGSNNDWSNILKDIEGIIHCAGIAHILNDKHNDNIDQYMDVNFEGTLNLAKQCVNAGVRRFIFISTIKVNGEESLIDDPFCADSLANPQDAYSISKFEAEKALLKFSQSCDMEIVIIRPPLIYGAQVKGNFLSLLKIVNKGIPLPFGAIKNMRSFVYIGNLVDLAMLSITHPKAANQVFLVSDDYDISTTQLFEEIGIALKRTVRLISIPQSLLYFGARILGKKDIAVKIMGNLQVDISKTKDLLSWKPPFNLSCGMKKSAKWYLKKHD